jgi:hypothetical protein
MVDCTELLHVTDIEVGWVSGAKIGMTFQERVAPCQSSDASPADYSSTSRDRGHLVACHRAGVTA